MKAVSRLTARFRRTAEEPLGRPRTIECKGCGRTIDIADLQLRKKFICRNCMRTLRLTKRLLRFRYTPRYRIRKRLLTLLLAVLLIGFSSLWGYALVSLDGLGHPVFFYGMTSGVAVLVSIYVAVAREYTEEYRLVGAFMLMALGLRRVVIWHYAEQWGHARPLEILQPGIVAIGFGLSFLVLVRRRRKVLSIR